MLKRLFDVLASSLGLALTFPIYPFIATAIKLDSPGPVFYRQTRVGLNGQRFKIIKFRTMLSDAESEGPITSMGDSRVTGVGRWLRRFEIDEMPTLINVFKGDMSIVGPRPEVPRYVQYYTPEQHLILSVRPGMTDLGTLKFRTEAELLRNTNHREEVYLTSILPEKLRLNREYIDRQSMLFDLRIILETLVQVLYKKKG